MQKQSMSFQDPGNIDFTDAWTTAKFKALCATAERDF